MTLTAKEAEQIETKKLGDAQKELLDAEKRLIQAQKASEQATAAVRAADPDSGANFTSRIEAKSLAEGRVLALEDKLAGARACLASAKAAAERAAMATLQVDLDDAKATLKSVDIDLVNFLREAREGARSRLANLEKLLARANASDLEMSKRRGEPHEGWRWPRHYGTLTSCLTDSREPNLLRYLEVVVDDEQHAWRRG